MKLEINYQKKAGKVTNMWKLNNMILNSYWVNEETKGEIKNYWKTKMKTQQPKTYGMQQKQF